MREKIAFWIWDKEPDWVPYWIDKSVLWILCLLYGHKAICDHCHRPEHDYCTYCNKSMPGAAHG